MITGKKLGIALVLLALVVISLAACAPTPVPTQVVTREAITPIGTATPSSSSPNPCQPSIKNILIPFSADAAVNAARLRLTQNGLSNPALVSVVHITPTTWLDDCLGLRSGMPCHSKATPGYLVELVRDGQCYLFHTYQDGKQARLAGSSIEPLGDVFIQWQYSDDQGCKTAVIGTEQMRFGICGEAMLAASSSASMWSDIKGQSQASYLKQTYVPFTANTIRGTLVFSGTGTLVASEAEQRAIAEWSLTRFEGANANYLPADHGLMLSWHEETASSCGGLWVYRTGLAVAWNCPGSAALGVGFLPAMQLRQFYAWLDGGERWNINRTDQVEGKALKTTLYFPWSDPGEGTTVEDSDNVLQFARGAYAGLTDTVPKK
jgi:hypothetical protein